MCRFLLIWFSCLLMLAPPPRSGSHLFTKAEWNQTLFSELSFMHWCESEGAVCVGGSQKGLRWVFAFPVDGLNQSHRATPLLRHWHKQIELPDLSKDVQVLILGIVHKSGDAVGLQHDFTPLLGLASPLFCHYSRMQTSRGLIILGGSESFPLPY